MDGSTGRPSAVVKVSPVSCQASSAASWAVLCACLRARRAALGSGYTTLSRMYIIMYTRSMKVMTMSESRANYAATLDAVIDDQEEVLITRPGGEGVVMVSQREYESMRETLYLMASPVNRRRLSEAVARLEAGGGTVRELADEDTTS